jgi:hypothetical protein
METLSSWRRSYAVLAIGTLVSVATADFLFYGHRIGWTAAVFTLVLLVLIAFRNSRFTRTVGGKIVAAAAVGLLLALVEQPTWLNVPYTILCLGGLAIVNAFGLPRSFPEWMKRWGRLLATGWMRLFSDNSVVIRWLTRHGVSPAVARSIVAWVVPVILASVFVAIFAWGNPILAEWLSKVGTWVETAIEKLPDIFNFTRMMFWLGFAMFGWALLRGRGRRLRVNRVAVVQNRNPAAAAIRTQAMVLRPKPIITVGLVVRCLVLFNAVFLVENALDVRFLGNKQLLLPTGIEYREYVRRGAYPLVAAALLAGTFVLIAFRAGRDTERSPWARRLVYAWIGQTIFLTMTAAWRLEQYVEMSELTRLRVASVIWFFLVGMGLAYVIWRIVKSKSNLWLLNMNAVTAAVVLYGCCFVNFDGMIADFNIRHCREGGGIGSSLDIDYFRDLGTSSLAQLDEIRPRIDLQWRRERAAKVSQDLHRELADEMSEWRGWTLRRSRVEREVEKVSALARAKQQVARAGSVSSE